MRYHGGMPTPAYVRAHIRGMSSTRKGKPSIGLQKLIDGISRKKKAEVSTREALDAAKVLDTDPKTRFQRYRDGTVIGGTMSPVVRAVGRGVEAAVMAPKGQRLRAISRGFTNTNKGELARHVTEGVIGGGGVKAVQEGLEVGRARKKLVQYIGSEKQAVDPVAVAGGIAAAKIMGANLLSRHGMALAPIRRIGQEVAGVGFRTAQQGKPMLSRPMRELISTTVDPKLVGAYETAHAVGSRVAPHQVAQVRQGLSAAAEHAPEVAKHVEFAKGIPLESKGIRRVVDYGFTPVGQVARDIGGAARRLVSPLVGAKTAADLFTDVAARAVKEAAPKLRPLPPIKDKLNDDEEI